MDWTKAQKDAINSLDGTLIVSAAAGSGKTSVLVERVINRITNSTNPCNANQLLIVTFTRAATSEMRERIDKAISRKLKSNPSDPHLLKQKMLLPSASICTIDSFCNDLVKENFFKLSITPDFKIISESERKLLAQESANEIIEELYTENSPEFLELVEFLFKGRDDSELVKSIIQLYDYSQAYAFPQKWLDDSLKLYSQTDDIKNNIFLNVLLEYIVSAFEFFTNRYEYILELIEQDEILKDKYSEFFKTEYKMLDSLKQLAINKEWDKLYDSISPKMFSRIPTIRGYDGESKDIIKGIRDDIKKIIKDKITPILCCNTTDLVEDLNYLKPIVTKLFEAVDLFNKRFFSKKQDQNYLDFNDITHLAINLLIEEQNGEYVRTALAKELSEKYVEILIDEYQDTNKAQDILFSSISKNKNNLFMVGDVKQSIYRFRKAMPQIFIQKRNSFNIFKNGNYPGVINLDKNYRSRKGVVEFINFVFSQIMSQDVGEVIYDDTEELKFGADYKSSTCMDTEIHIIDTSNNEEDLSTIQLEAKHIANSISDTIDNGTTIQNKDGTLRKATYKDFCILLRSTKDKSNVYTKELQSQGIPALGDNSGGFFDTYEISVVISLLKVIDNPINDIPLLSVLMSPIFGFSPDDIANIRLKDRSSNLYTCLTKLATEGNIQCKQFINCISLLRKFSVALPVCDLIAKLYNETDFLNIFLAMKNGERRHANLMLLQDFAVSFDTDKANGLSSFVRYVDSIKEKNIDIGATNNVSPSINAVQIMSIHKSKGLEFPICIIANCSKGFNKEDLKNNMILHPKLGVGMTRRNTKNMHEFETIMHLATKQSTFEDSLSEEMRVLYVAMTRAREKLICVMTCKNIESKIKKLTNTLSSNMSIPSFSIKNCNSFADWILSSCVRHPDAISLRNSFESSNINTLKTDSGVCFKIINDSFSKESNETKNHEFCESDDNLMREIIEKTSFKYKYDILKNVPTKCAASHKDANSLSTQFFAKSKPSFLNESGLTPAQKGTALHRFMQYANYQKASENIELELDRLLNLEFLSKEEVSAIDIRKLQLFFKSNLYYRISNSPNVMREKKFAINISASEFKEDIPNEFNDEKILIQGIADCAFVENGKLVIVDYKTDKVKSADELALKYTDQLKIYSTALSQCTELPIKQALLYSFSLNDTIEIKS